MICDQRRLGRLGYLAVCGGVVALLAAAPSPGMAQATRGFEQIAEASARLEEQNRQQDLWVLEVHLKQMRMVWVPPPAGGARDEEIWYLAYRAVNRPLQRAETGADTRPVNTLDPVPQKPLFIPELTLVTYSDPEMQVPTRVYRDVVLPTAVSAINRIESRRPDDPLLKDTVSVIQPVPDPAPKGEDGEWIYGVATWRGVDPDTDFFKVILSGFSNGYEERVDENGQRTIWRKVLVQAFTRRGDRFDPNQAEFEFAGPPRWEYHPEEPSGTTAVTRDAAEARTR